MLGETRNIDLSCSPAFSEKIRAHSLNAGADLVSITTAEPFADIAQILLERKALGYAGSMQFTYRNPERSTDVSQSLEGAQSLVVCAVSYAHEKSEVPDNPYARVASYTTSQARDRLDNALKSISLFLRNAGWKTKILVDDNGLVDRAAAMRAGIGFYGKNALIITQEYGSTVLLGSVATTAPLHCDAHHQLEDSTSGCGTCTQCIPACPTGAIERPGIINASKCLSWIAQSPDDISHEHRIAMGNRIYGCDECQDACPYNKIQQRRTSTDALFPQTLDLDFLLSCTDAELLQTAGEWYVYDRDPRYLRRNVLIIAGNILPDASPSWEDVRAFSVSDDEFIAQYALWALDQRATRKRSAN